MKLIICSVEVENQLKKKLNELNLIEEVSML